MKIQEENIDYIDTNPLGIKFFSVSHYPPHYHSHAIEIIFCLKGTVIILSGFQQIVLEEGEYFTVDHRDIHCLYSDDTDNIVMSVYLNLLETEISWNILKYIMFVFESTENNTHHNAHITLVTDILMLIGYLCTNNSSTKIPYNEIANTMLSILTNHFDWFNYACGEKELSDQKKELLYRASVYIQNHYMKKISLSTFAKEEHFDKTYIAYLSKYGINHTFNESLHYVRSSKAEFLLLTTDKSNDDICTLCGFSDTKYYYKHFKIWWGKTPMQHRKWYEKYMSEPDCYTVLSRQEISSFMKEYYCEYNIKRIILKT